MKYNTVQALSGYCSSCARTTLWATSSTKCGYFCEECAGRRQTSPHKFVSSTYYYYTDYHRQKCQCGTNYQNQNPHNADVAATCTVQPYCNTCNHLWGAALGHADPGVWSTNASQHYRYCSRGCGTLLAAENHYDTAVNGYCDVCNYVLDATAP